MGHAGPKGARTNDRRRGCACAPDAGRVVCNARQMGQRRVRRQVMKSATTDGGARFILTSTPTLTPFSAAAVYPSKAALQDEVSRLDAAMGLDKYLPHRRAKRQTSCWTILMRDCLASPPQETAEESERRSARWVRKCGHCGHKGQLDYAEASANAILTLLAVACSLLDRQRAAQAAAFQQEGGFTERLYRVRSQSRSTPSTSSTPSTKNKPC